MWIYESAWNIGLQKSISYFIYSNATFNCTANISYFPTDPISWLMFNHIWDGYKYIRHFDTNNAIQYCEYAISFTIYTITTLLPFLLNNIMSFYNNFVGFLVLNLGFEGIHNCKTWISMTLICIKISNGQFISFLHDKCLY